MQAAGERAVVAVLSIKIAAELMTDKCGHDGLRKMDFIRPAPPVIRPAPQTVLHSGRTAGGTF